MRLDAALAGLQCRFLDKLAKSWTKWHRRSETNERDYFTSRLGGLCGHAVNMTAGIAENYVERREHELLSLGTAGAALARDHMLAADHGAPGTLGFRRGLLLEVMGMFKTRADMVAELLFGLPRCRFGRRACFSIVAGPLGRIREYSVSFEDTF